MSIEAEALALEWCTTLVGSAGALILAMNRTYSKWGWVLFLLANSIGFAWAVHTEHWGFVLQNSIFGITSIVGIRRWIVNPEKNES